MDFLSLPFCWHWSLLLAAAFVRFAGLGENSFVMDELWRAHRVADSTLARDWTVDKVVPLVVNPLSFAIASRL